MTVEELINELSKLPNNTEVIVKEDGELRVRCGCFNGTLEEFAAKVVGTHGNDDFGKVYKAIIEVIKLRFGLNKTE